MITILDKKNRASARLALFLHLVQGVLLLLPLLYSEDDMEQEEVYYGFNEDERPFEISRDDDASWVLSGEKLEKLFVMTNMERDESIMKFARQLRGMGVDEALRERGAKDGDIVRIGNFEFEFVD